MTRLTETAYAKINLALHVRARRSDGYHEIETLFAFVDGGDVLHVEPADDLSLEIIGPFGAGLSAADDNLVLKAARALQQRNGIESGARFTLDKRLPVASGIGGGSADAAAALRLGVRLWELDEAASRPMDIAAAIGADVPACVLSQSCMGTNLGDQLAPVDGSPLSGTPILLVNPLLSCPTGAVFAAWDGVDRGPLNADDWRSARNDLEQPAIALVPQIADVLDVLRDLPEVRLARMSGSGATCFALFADEAARDAARAEIAAQQPAWWTCASVLR